MELILQRTYYSSGTNGKLYFNGRLLCYTIELPWRNNDKGTSCIPEGMYRVNMRYSLKFKTHMVLTDVKERALILIHPANNAIKELRGCIAPVTRLSGVGKGDLSRAAFDKVKSLVLMHIDDEPIYLIIKS